jgi:hypothetical protein
MYFKKEIIPVLKERGRMPILDERRLQDGEMEITIVTWFDRSNNNLERTSIVETAEDSVMSFIVFGEYNSSNVIETETYALDRDVALSYVI